MMPKYAHYPSHINIIDVSSQLASSNDYGKQAHRDLIVTRGAGFRKEKNKKKRGSYRGGEITVCFNIFFSYVKVLNMTINF